MYHVEKKKKKERRDGIRVKCRHGEKQKAVLMPRKWKATCHWFLALVERKKERKKGKEVG